MKKFTLILFLITLLFGINVFAQRSIELFCKITVGQARHGIDVITIDYGNNDHFKNLKDSLIINSLNKVNLFNNQIDAFNYMGSLGWECINIVSVVTQVHMFPYDKFVCVFKKVFVKEDMQ